MSAFGANYQVWVEFGIRNAMAAGVRSMNAQMLTIQRQAKTIGAQTEAQLKRVQGHYANYSSIWGNPKTTAEAKKQISDIHAHQATLQNSLATATNAAEQQAISSKLQALGMTERDLKAKKEALNVTEMQGRAEQRNSVNAARSQYRMFSAGQREARQREQNLKSISHGAFKTAEYAGLGALGIGAILGTATYQAAQQQQYAASTALDLGFRNPAQMAAAQNQLITSAINASMAVGQLSSADVANIQTILTQHLGLTRGPGLQRVLGLTLPVSKFADVMKLSTGADVRTSASVATRVANMFGVTDDAQLYKILNSIFVMANSTGAPLERFMNALSYFGPLGKNLGFSPESMISLYGESYRLGIGGGKSGQRLGAIVRGLGNIPTTFMQAAFSNMLGVHGNMGLLPQLTDKQGNVHLVGMLRWFNDAQKRLIAQHGLVQGRALFVNALAKGGMGTSAAQALMSLVQSASIQGVLNQKARASKFASVDQAQQYFLGLPMGRMAQFQTNLRSFLIEFGRHGLPLMTKFFQDLAATLDGWTKWMQKNPQGTANIFKGLATLGAAFAGIAGLSLGVGVITNLIRGFTAISGLFIEGGALAGVASLATPIGLIVAGIAALVIVIENWKSILWAAEHPITAFKDGLVNLERFLHLIPSAGSKDPVWSPWGRGRFIYPDAPGGPLIQTHPSEGPWHAPIQHGPGATIVGHHGQVVNLHIHNSVGGKNLSTHVVNDINKFLQNGVRSSTTNQGTTYMSNYVTSPGPTPTPNLR